MFPSRGDRKPCTVEGCKGMMQFGRRPPNEAAPAASKGLPAASGAPGWNCSTDSAHFRTAAADAVSSR